MLNNLSLRLTLISAFVVTAAGLIVVAQWSPAATPALLRFQPWLGALLLLIPVAWTLAGPSLGATGALAAACLSLWAAGISSEHAVLWSTAALVTTACLSAASWRRERRLQRSWTAQREQLEVQLESHRLAVAEQQADLKGFRRRRDRYQQLQFIGERLSSTLSLGEIAWVAVEHCFLVVGHSSACLLFLLDSETQELGLFASRRAPGVPPLREKRGGVFEQWVLRYRRMLLVSDLAHDDRFHAKAEAASGRAVCSTIAAPLVVGGRLYGVVRLDSEAPNAYTQDDLRVLDILSDLISVAVANAYLYAQTQRLAMTDGLTGLLLRRYFLEECDRELQRKHPSAGHVVAVLMIDIDNFKQYNDTFGHAAGDLVLKGVAKTLTTAAPHGSTVARYGGEEFAVLLVGASLRQAVAVAESLRKQIAGASFELRRQQTTVTVSLGAAAAPADGRDAMALLRAADARLYAAKRAGKNRVCHSSS